MFGDVNVCSQLFFSTAHVTAFIVLRISVEVIDRGRRQPAIPYTQARFRFLNLNCCHLQTFDEINDSFS